MRIVILEPDAMVSRILTETVRKMAGVSALKTVRNIKQLTQVYEDEKPHLIVGEVHLPDGELTDWLLVRRQRGDAVDFLPVTGDDRTVTYLALSGLGAVDYILKPFQEPRVLKALTTYSRWRGKLLPDAKITQKMLDRYSLHTGADPTLNADAFVGNDKTWALLHAFMQSRKGMSFTAREAAQAIGVSLTTLRRYLESMLGDDRLEVLTEYGHIGRPTHHYRLK